MYQLSEQHIRLNYVLNKFGFLKNLKDLKSNTQYRCLEKQPMKILPSKVNALITWLFL